MSTAQITIPLDIPDARVLQMQLTAHQDGQVARKTLPHVRIDEAV